MHLNDFTNEALLSLQEFRTKYMEKHMADPEKYPIDLPESNAGLWHEFLFDYMINGTV